MHLLGISLSRTIVVSRTNITNTRPRAAKAERSVGTILGHQDFLSCSASDAFLPPPLSLSRRSSALFNSVNGLMPFITNRHLLCVCMCATYNAKKLMSIYNTTTIEGSLQSIHFFAGLLSFCQSMLLLASPVVIAGLLCICARVVVFAVVHYITRCSFRLAFFYLSAAVAH